jgi:transposase
MVTTPTTQPGFYNDTPRLYMAMELSRANWKIAFTTGEDGKVRKRDVPSWELERLLEEVAQAKRRLGLPEDAPTFSCYESGREAFSIHRLLTQAGIDNIVIDAASIEVNRKARRAKTDNLDLDGLIERLVRYHHGQRVWSVVRVPSVEEEDARRPTREIQRLKKERTQHRNRIRGLLLTQGVALTSFQRQTRDLDALHTRDGQPLPLSLRGELERELLRLHLLERQIKELNAQTAQQVEEAATPALRQAKTLTLLRGVGADSATLLATEFFSWRDFKNRREVGAAAGLVGSPYSSGDSEREQGISKAGNTRVRARMIELAWLWLRFQPRSKQARWFQEKFGQGKGRMRRVGIVALARRLLIDFWRLVEQGVVPEGAQIAVA